MASLKRHFVWGLVEHIDGYYHCSICPSKYGSKTGVSTLKNHFSQKHPVQYENKEREALEKEENEKLKLERSAHTNIRSDQTYDKNTRLLLAKSFAVHNDIFSLLDNPFFRMALKRLSPEFHIPCSKTLERDLLELYKHIQKSIVQQIRGQKYTICSDGWSSVNGTLHIYNIIVYFIERETNARRKELLCLREVPNQKSETLSKMFRAALDNLNLTSDCLGAVTDGARNVRKSVRMLGIESTRCAAHSLQLIANEICESRFVNNSINKCRRVVKLLNRSSNTKQFFLQKAVDLGLPSRKIRGFSLTRWLAAVILVKDCLEYEEVIKSSDFMLNCHLTREEKSSCIYFCKFGSLLEDALSQIERADSAITEIIPIFSHIIKQAKLMDEFKDEDDENHTFAQLCLSAVEKRLEEFTSSYLHVGSLLFDPRFYLLDVLPDSINWTAVREQAQEIFKTYKKHCNDEVLEPAVKVLKTNSFWESVQEQSCKNTNGKVRDFDDQLASEMFSYESELRAARPFAKSSPIRFWTSRQEKYRLLGQFALLVHCFPASSADSERLFSRCGSILADKKRGSMSAEKLERLLVVGNDGYEKCERQLEQSDQDFADLKEQIQYSEVFANNLFANSSIFGDDETDSGEHSTVDASVKTASSSASVEL